MATASLGWHHPQVRLCRKLQQAKYRRQLGLFLIEGAKLLAEAEQAGVEIVEVFALEDRQPRPGGGPPLIVPAQLMASMATTATAPPILAIGRIPRAVGGGLPAPPDLFPILVGVKDAGNLGAVLRVAQAVGCPTIGLAGGTVDPYNPKVLRSSMGSAFHVRIRQIEDRHALAMSLRQSGFCLVATAPRGDKVHYKQDFRRPTALFLGSEASGLPDAWLREVDDIVTIPLRGGADSLNVAVAAGVILYEAIRQRAYGSSS